MLTFAGLTLPALFGNPTYASLFAILVTLAVGSLALYADEVAARRRQRGEACVRPPDLPARLLAEMAEAWEAGEYTALAPTPANGDALN